MSDLKMFFDGEDWVIAENAEEAHRINCALLGERPEDYEVSNWKVVAVDDELTFDDGDTKTASTVAEWIAKCGKGHWASVNY